ncbi:MAG: hypothetical protein WDN23_19665 [Edaphobacter sp.]
MSHWLRVSFGLRVLVLASGLAAGVACAQTAGVTASGPETVVDILREFSGQAAVIFAGQVLAVRQPGTGVVEVEFRVDEAIRGCSTGAPYVLREWDGLWVGGAPRYRVGQRLLMLLHAPSAAGMSSPVGGLDGAIPIRQGSAATESGGAAQPPYVDLRWLGARVPRKVEYAAQPTRRVGAAARAAVVAAEGCVGAAPIVVMGGGGESSSVPSQQASVDAVMGMLKGWERAQHEAP